MCHQTHLAIWTITDFLTFVQLKNSKMINYRNIPNNETKHNFIIKTLKSN